MFHIHQFMCSLLYLFVLAYFILVHPAVKQNYFDISIYVSIMYYLSLYLMILYRKMQLMNNFTWTPCNADEIQLSRNNIMIPINTIWLII